MRSAAPTRLSSAQSTQIRAVGILLEMRLMCAVRGDTAVSRQSLGKLRLGGARSQTLASLAGLGHARSRPSANVRSCIADHGAWPNSRAEERRVGKEGR